MRNKDEKQRRKIRKNIDQKKGRQTDRQVDYYVGYYAVSDPIQQLETPSAINASTGSTALWLDF